MINQDHYGCEDVLGPLWALGRIQTTVGEQWRTKNQIGRLPGCGDLSGVHQQLSEPGDLRLSVGELSPELQRTVTGGQWAASRWGVSKQGCLSSQTGRRQAGPRERQIIKRLARSAPCYTDDAGQLADHKSRTQWHKLGVKSGGLIPLPHSNPFYFYVPVLL